LNRLLLATIIIIGLGVAYYSLYQYNYNELVYAQQDNAADEERLRAIWEALENVPVDPEGQRINNIFNQTEEARRALPLIESARSPLQLNVVNDTGKGDMLDTIPFTKPGQIHIDIRSGSGELNIANNHSNWIPLRWSGIYVLTVVQI
jgi:hypothetical protein